MRPEHSRATSYRLAAVLVAGRSGGVTGWGGGLPGCWQDDDENHRGWLAGGAVRGGFCGCCPGCRGDAEAGGRDAEGVAVVELVSLGDAAAFFPAADHGGEAFFVGKGVAGEGGGFAELAGHLLDVPAPCLALLADPLAAGAGVRGRRCRCLAGSGAGRGLVFHDGPPGCAGCAARCRIRLADSSGGRAAWVSARNVSAAWVTSAARAGAVTCRPGAPGPAGVSLIPSPKPRRVNGGLSQQRGAGGMTWMTGPGGDAAAR